MDLDPDLLDLGFHFSTSQILASLVFGVVGIFLFRLGRRELNYRVIFVSIALMAYPMFTKGPLQDWGVGVVLCGLAYYFRKNANLTG